MSTTDDLLQNAKNVRRGVVRQGRPADASRAQDRDRCVHGRAAQSLRPARPAGGRRPRDPKRRRRRHRRRDPLAGDQPAPARHRGDRADPPHRLRHADVHRRRVQGLDPGGHRHQAGVGGRDVLGPRRRRPPVDRADQGQPVHPQQELGARLRLRGRDRTRCARSNSLQGWRPGMPACSSAASSAFRSRASTASSSARSFHLDAVVALDQRPGDAVLGHLGDQLLPSSWFSTGCLPAVRQPLASHLAIQPLVKGTRRSSSRGG